MFWCDHCGHAFEIPERHHLRGNARAAEGPGGRGPGSGCVSELQQSATDRIYELEWLTPSGSTRSTAPTDPPLEVTARSRRGL